MKEYNMFAVLFVHLTNDHCRVQLLTQQVRQHREVFHLLLAGRWLTGYHFPPHVCKRAKSID